MVGWNRRRAIEQAVASKLMGGLAPHLYNEWIWYPHIKRGRHYYHIGYSKEVVVKKNAITDDYGAREGLYAAVMRQLTSGSTVVVYKRSFKRRRDAKAKAVELWNKEMAKRGARRA